MRVLYYLNPKIELNNPLFRFPTLKHSIIPQIKSLNTSNVDFKLILSKSVYLQALKEKLLEKFELNDFIIIDEVSLTNSNFREVILESVSDELIEFNPDLIVSWESDISFFSEIVPNAKVIYQQPGAFSREPFVKLISFDTGLLSNSAFIDLENSDESDFGIELVSMLREKKQIIDNFSPIKSVINRYKGRFSKLILFPLQVDNYFTVDEVTGKSQLDVLIDLLNKTPEDIGFIVTQYTSKNINSNVINPKMKEYLSSKYSNFIFDESFDSINSVSQYICPCVDGVIVISTSLAYQAALWNKNIYSVGLSQVSSLSNSKYYSEFIKNVYSSKFNDKDNVLSNILEKYNYPQNLIFHKKDFLKSVYQSVLNDSDFELTDINKLDIKDDYLNSDWDESFKKSASKYFESALVDLDLGACPDLLEQIKRKDVISFDIFDTLLYRPFFKPVDLFEFISEDASSIVGKKIDFKAIRMLSEKKAFEFAVSEERYEIDIDEIYNVLKGEIEVSESIACKLKDLEVNAERNFLYKRESGYKAYEYAKSLRKRVILVSDMYLKKSHLEDILKHTGYYGYEKVYVSSEYGCKKHNGLLFDKVLEDLDVETDRILHIGDNLRADVIKAKERGIKAFHLVKATEKFVDLPTYQTVWSRDFNRNSIYWNSVLSIIANKYCNNPYKPQRRGSIFNGSRTSCGYMAFGPLLFGYTKWLIEESIKNGVEELYFLARDGKIMKSAYDLLASSYSDAPASKYLLCSRRSVNVSKIASFDDIVDLLNVDIAKTSLEDFLFNRFGVSISSIDIEMLIRYDLTALTKIDNANKQSLLPFIEEISPTILDNSKSERELYLEYLDNMGFLSSNKKAIVDIGYAGTMQQSLSQLTESKFDGYYLITFRDAIKRIKNNGMEAHAFLANYIDRHDTYHQFCRFVPLYETFFSSTDNSFSNFIKVGDEIEPVYVDSLPCESRRVSVLEDIQSGALDFIKEFVLHFDGYIDRFDFEPNKSLRYLNELFSNPNIHDTRILEGVMFEDGYGGQKVKVILHENHPQNHKKHVVWQKGLQAQRESFNSSINKQQEVVKNKRNIKYSIETVSEEDLRTISSSGFIDKSVRRLKRFKNNPIKFISKSKYTRWMTAS
ncbi:HAD family hydrolase [Vibrio splendidus]